jgi:hypothetical protein
MLDKHFGMLHTSFHRFTTRQTKRKGIIMATIVFDEYAYNAAIKRNIIDNAQKTFFRTYPDGNAIFNFIVDKHDNNEFCRSLYNAFNTYGKLTEKQVAAVRGMMQKAAEFKAARNDKIAAVNASKSFVGNVGDKKVPFVLTVKKVIPIETMYGTNWIHINEDQAGNVVIYKGTAEFGKEGETIKILATIKEHAVYNGTKQTIIQRPKIVEEKQAA